MAPSDDAIGSSEFPPFFSLTSAPMLSSSQPSLTPLSSHNPFSVSVVATPSSSISSSLALPSCYIKNTDGTVSPMFYGDAGVVSGFGRLLTSQGYGSHGVLGGVGSLTAVRGKTLVASTVGQSGLRGSDQLQLAVVDGGTPTHMVASTAGALGSGQWPEVDKGPVSKPLYYS